MIAADRLQYSLDEARRSYAVRLQDLARWLENVDPADRQALRECGHRLHGTAGSYGFERISLLGAELERLAADAEPEAIRAHCRLLRQSLIDVMPR